MPTILNADLEGVAAASQIICAGGLVVIPTETVYGLAADAMNEASVAEIFRIKGRPSTNPVIVHVHSVEQAKGLGDFNKTAQDLAKAFWPGPLTIVVEATNDIPSIVTAGGSTVGLRMPSHSLALKLLQSCGRPLAAPSANRSEGVSPTTVADVIASLGDQTPPLLDGGSCAVGIESTVIDVTNERPAILRPGGISRAEIEAVLSIPVAIGAISTVRRSPGQMTRHYAPATKTVISSSSSLAAYASPGSALLYHTDPFAAANQYPTAIKLPANPALYARQLYVTLNQLDRSAAELIVVEELPETDEWLAVRDRIKRAGAAKS